MATECLVANEEKNKRVMRRRIVDIWDWGISKKLIVRKLSAGDLGCNFQFEVPATKRFPFDVQAEISIDQAYDPDFSQSNRHRVMVSPIRGNMIATEAVQIPSSQDAVPTINELWKKVHPVSMDIKLLDMKRGFFDSEKEKAVFSEWEKTEAGKVSIKRALEQREVRPHFYR